MLVRDLEIDIPPCVPAGQDFLEIPKVMGDFSTSSIRTIFYFVTSITDGSVGNSILLYELLWDYLMFYVFYSLHFVTSLMLDEKITGMLFVFALCEIRSF